MRVTGIQTGSPELSGWGPPNLVADGFVAAKGVAEDWVAWGCPAALGSGAFALGLFTLGVDDGETEAEGLTPDKRAGVGLFRGLALVVLSALPAGLLVAPVAVSPTPEGAPPVGALALGWVRLPPCQAQATLPPSGTLSPSTPMLE